MGIYNVEKKSFQYAGQCAWKVAQYLLLCTCYSIGISLRPASAQPKTLPLVSGVNRQTSPPLTYKIVQTESQDKPTTNIQNNGSTVELNADEQEFDNNSQVITATGKVVLKFNKAVLNADKLRVNLKTKIAIATGNVSLIRGQQILYGNQFEYNFEDDKGSITDARGDIYQPTLVTDLNVAAKSKIPQQIPAGERTFTEPLLSDRLRNDRPVTSIQSTSSTGIVVGSEKDIEYQPTLKPTGKITRLRFQADKVDFVGEQITAEKIRITNDPFSPPEVQVKADRAEFKTLNSEEDEIITNNPRIIIENSIDLPFPRDRLIVNKLGKDPNPFNIGFDTSDRGGLYVERNFYPIFNSKFRLSITPQYFLQRALTNLNFFDPSVLGVRTNLEANVSPDTTVQISAALAGLSSANFRGKASVKQNLGLFNVAHTFTGEAVYREQVFNGSLGLQDVQASLGGVLTSSNIPIGNTGINFDYQIGAQNITANTDLQRLLDPIRNNDFVTLNRYQAAVNLNKGIRLWEGKGLSPNDKETYNYSPVPVVPYIQLNTGLKGNWSSYSNGDTQSSIGYNVGIQGQFGNFSRSSFDYTGFNINYAQQFRGVGSSPFLFDRLVDNRILSAGISQQISGPFRLGVQTSINLDTGNQFSTDYYLEYSRRTYNLILRYNPALQLGSFGFRLNDFNWDGTTPRF
jgi:lipopolysaccharide export system protein LptA